MSAPVTPHLPFDPRRRAAIAGRAAQRRGPPFLLEMQAEELADRLALVSRPIRDVLLLGSIHRVADRLGLPADTTVTVMGGSTAAATARVIDASEDGADPGAAAYDLVIAGGATDSVNDLPGMLALARRALRPDCLFLACLAGAGSLATLRRALLEAESAVPGAGVGARIHPQVDVRAGGDLLTRAGFALPVADLAPLRLGYADPARLIADLRDAGLTSALAGPRPPLRRAAWAALAAGWSREAADDGRTVETINWLMLTGWSPGPDQPQPARRGSATASLAAALGDKRG